MPALGLAVGGAVDVPVEGWGKAVTEHDFVSVLEHALDQRKPDTAALAYAIVGRFGRGQFEAGVRAALSRLGEAK
jgi:hypothetical protein